MTLPAKTAVIAVGGIERGGARAIITSPDHLEEAPAGRTGTHVVAG